MKKVFVSSFFVAILSLLFLAPSVSFAEGGEFFICLANFCYLHSAPSFTAEKIKDGDSYLKISHKDVLVLELENGEPKKYGAGDEIFYKVESVKEKTYENAYIFSDFVAKVDDIITLPAFNASINKDALLYNKVGEDFEESDVEVKKGERVFLYDGYDKDASFTPVAIQKNNSLLYGYVPTDVVAPDGVNPLIIYAVTIAIACIGIIMALLFMKNKKKKSKEMVKKS